MKTKFPLLVLSGYCLLTAASLNAAGLRLSNDPLFVTEVLPPNVIITPTYRGDSDNGSFDSNEVALKNTPWDVLNKCRANSANCPNGSIVMTTPPWYGTFNSGGYVFAPTRIKRVTPWPGAVKYLSQPYGRNVVCGTAGIYPLDIFTQLDNPPFVTGYTSNYPLKCRINAAGDRETSSVPLKTEELYPDLLNNIGANYYNEALSKYVRSDSNFLYFNKQVADRNAREGYKPWPTLGVSADVYSPIVYDLTTAKEPYYSSLYRAAGKVRIDQTAKSYVMIDFNQDVSSAFEQTYLIGQYYTFDNTKNVWDATAYTGANWDAGMDDKDKVNFAHWFTYWRTSYSATRGMLSQFLDKLGPNGADLLDRFRLGIAYTGSDNRYNIKVGRVEPLTADERQNSPVASRLAKNRAFIEGLGRNIIFNAGVKFRSYNATKANDYYKLYPSAYKDDPTASDSDWTGARSCRRNYEIILTPDYTSLADNAVLPVFLNTTVANATADLGVGSPYEDSVSSRWGDAGMAGWKNSTADVEALADTLLPGQRDEATWQHVVRYIVGPTAKGRIFNETITNYDQAINILKTRAAGNWPLFNNTQDTAVTDNIDDLWHMALNSRGFFYPSESVDIAVDNLLKAFTDILVRNVSGSSVATNTTSLQTGAQIYQATVESDWKGHLRAYSLVKTRKEVNGTQQDVVSVTYGSPNWDLAEKISAVSPSDRKIFTYNRDSSGGALFNWASMDASSKTAFTAAYPLTGQAEALVDYLRGSGRCEDGASTVCTADSTNYAFRRRNLNRSETRPYSTAIPDGRNVLGDITNSNPWYVSRPLAGISDVDYPGYNSHRITYKDRPSVLYVGSNNGMLHAVRTDDNYDADGRVVGTSVKGTELFAYIPSFVINRLPALGSQAYIHQFYVDGSPFSAEADMGSGVWKTVLAGGANKGGKGYYLLDITTPATFSASSVLWEFTNDTDNDLNYTYNFPISYPVGHTRVGQARQIVKLNDGKWALIVGNGYPEDAGKRACLFIIYLSGPGGGWSNGVNYRKLCVGNSDYSAAVGSVPGGGLDTNGLSTPTPVDLNGDGMVDVVYAGDLNGNMWKFDLSSSHPEVVETPWAVAYGGKPFFVAINGNGKRQAIISPPEVTLLSTGGKSGQMVLFGTGKFLEDTDRVNADVQSFYGVWDRNLVELSGLTRSVLNSQTFSTATTGTTQYRKQDEKVEFSFCFSDVLSGCTTDGTKLGWYWDMTDTGERMTGRANLLSGVVVFNTFAPGVVDGQLDPCQYGGSGWIMGLNSTYGYMETDYPVFDANIDGVIDSNDPKAAGVRVGAAIGGTTFARMGSDSMVGVYSPTSLGTASSEGDKMTMRINLNPNSTGRVSWFELTN
ncbi:MAG: PilC/PilY family type IV pilus protein [Gallionellaceae bacterium]|nr:PilC/PilY family type IV pilus protein [Gallionellaceae bacterium]